MKAQGNSSALTKTNQCGLPNGQRTTASMAADTAAMDQQKIAAK
jgi:hypothetical protein